LTLEYLESAFYNEKGKTVGLSGQAKTYATDFGAQEAEHVKALMAAIKSLGGTPVAKPTFVFPVSNQSSFLALASTLENTGVGAYNGAAPKISSKEVLAEAGSIVQIEARHAAGDEIRFAEETRDETVGRPVIEFVRRARLRHPAAAHHGDAVRHDERFFLVVGHIERGARSRDMHASYLDLHVFAQLLVERAQRLVHQQDVGLDHYRPRQSHTLLLAPGQTAHRSPAKAVETHRP